MLVAVSSASAATWDPPVVIAPIGAAGSQIEWTEGLPGQSTLMEKQDARGDVAVAWTRDDIGAAASRHVEVAYRPAGQAWLAPEGVGPPRSVLAGLAMDAHGDLTVAYNSTDGDILSQLRVVTRSYDGTWGAVAGFGTPGAARNGPTGSVMTDDAGDLLVAYDDPANNLGQIETAFRPANGAWQPSVNMEPSPIDAGISIAGLGMAANGDATMLVVSNNTDHDPRMVVQRRFRPISGWQAATPAFSMPVQARGTSQFAVSPSGDATYVASFADGALMATSRAAGSQAWTPFVPLGTPAPGYYCRPLRLAVDSAGEAIVACAGIEPTMPRSETYAAVRGTDGAWGPLAVVATNTAGSADSVGLALADDGHALLAVILDPIAAGEGLRTQLFERLPGQPWVPATAPAGDPPGQASALIAAGPGHEIISLRLITSLVGNLYPSGIEATLLSQAAAPPAKRHAEARRFAGLAVVGRRACRTARHACSAGRRARFEVALLHGQKRVRLTVQRLIAGRWGQTRRLSLRPEHGRITLRLRRGRVRVSTTMLHDTRPHVWAVYVRVGP